MLRHISGVDVLKSTIGLAFTVMFTGAGSEEFGGLIPLLSVKLFIVIIFAPTFRLLISTGMLASIGVFCATTPKVYV